MRNGAAVEGNERLVRAWRGAVDCLGAQLLAGAAFTGDEGRRAGGRDCRYPALQILHRGRRAQHGDWLADPLCGVWRSGLCLVGCVAQGGDQAVAGDRLDQVVPGACTHCIHGGVDRGVRGYRDDDGLRCQCLRAGYQLCRVAAGQFERHERDERRVTFQCRSGGVSAASECARITLGFQVGAVGAGNRATVLDDEDGFLTASRT
jgi:hypothetical protein